MVKLDELYVKLMVDGIEEMVSDLKRVQREAKKATKAIRELETYYTDATTNESFYVKWKQSHDDECTDIREVCMSDIPTKYLERELEKREVDRTSLAEAYKLLRTHGSDGNWNYDQYMHGMYNGMETILATLEGREPSYRDAPSKFIEPHCDVTTLSTEQLQRELAKRSEVTNEPV